MLSLFLNKYNSSRLGQIYWIKWCMMLGNIICKLSVTNITATKMLAESFYKSSLLRFYEQVTWIFNYINFTHTNEIKKRLSIHSQQIGDLTFRDTIVVQVTIEDLWVFREVFWKQAFYSMENWGGTFKTMTWQF